VSITATATSRDKLDDLRRLTTDLGIGAGLAPARAAAFASHLLWFDAAGIGRFGLASLGEWLDRIARGEIDPRAEGTFGVEHAGTAAMDGRGGLAPLVLARAAGVAVEKARDVGIGLVRVANLGAAGPAAPIVAEAAVGPTVALAIGPEGSWAMALPSAEGLPAVFDSAIDGTRPEWVDAVAPWASALVPERGWLILALAVAALEPLGTFHERVAAGAAIPGPTPGRLRPDEWETRRREARERGVALDPAVRADLIDRAGRLGLSFPKAQGGPAAT